ncbi:hypothetical protein NGM37_30495, partial [Streptomyces sp. TRM76130]|nr:hypothetical protein [Streptomyces sp. TRM76130]
GEGAGAAVGVAYGEKGQSIPLGLGGFVAAIVTPSPLGVLDGGAERLHKVIGPVSADFPETGSLRLDRSLLGPVLSHDH